MDEARIRSAAGFAMRAGCCVSGDFACEKAVKSGRAQFVLLDAGASDATLDRRIWETPSGNMAARLRPLRITGSPVC